MENNNVLKVCKKSEEKYTEKLGISVDGLTNFTMEQNAPLQKQGLALEFLQILFKYAHISTVFCYKIKTFYGVQGKLQYYIKQHRMQRVLCGILYFLLCANLMLVVINYSFNVSYSLLVNLIKRTAYGVFAISLVIVCFCLETEGRKQGLWLKILEQADLIQDKFVTLGIPLPSISKIKLAGRLICIGQGLMCCFQISVFFFTTCPEYKSWYGKSVKSILSALTLYSWEFDVNEINPVFGYIIGTIGLLLQIICWNMWYFTDALRVFSSLMVWIVFRGLNNALESGKLSIEKLNEIMNLHFDGVKLLNLFNKLLGPITLSSTFFNILYVCFWTNYTLISFDFRMTHIVGLLTVIRMMAVFFITADVNTQAYRISMWLEDNFQELERKAVKVERNKISLFTSMIYNREIIGFKGLNFFTVTPALNVAIAGLVLTYTVAVNQFATQ